MRISGMAAVAGVTLMLGAAALTGPGFAHGDVQPQPVDTTGLKPLGEEWVATNPYKGDETAIGIGSSGYNQNCARCHGLEAISGGISPDLRNLEDNDDGDSWFITRVRGGATQNGVTKMPAFEGILSQEAMWAIRAYIVSRPKD